MIKKIYQVSEQAILCDFGEKINKNINSKVISFFNYINNINNKTIGIKNCVPSYNKVLIHYDLNKTNHLKIIELIKSIKIEKLSNFNYNNSIELPICYDDEFALDINKISEKFNIGIEEIINLHLSTEFYVYMIGFMPGLPFMGDLSQTILTSRLLTPRLRVPARSVGIVDKFCVIYPFESPGGWNIIGRTPKNLFFKNKKKPTLLLPGYKVKFVRISKNEFYNIESKL